MFKNKNNALSKAFRGLKVIDWLLKNGLYILMVIYYLVAILFNMGNRIANVIFLILTIITLIITFRYSMKELNFKERLKEEEKQHVKRKTIKILKILTKVYALCASLYAIYLTSNSVNFISVILSVLLIVGWFVNFLVDIIILTIENKRGKFIKSINKDLDKVDNKIKSIFNKKKK